MDLSQLDVKQWSFIWDIIQTIVLVIIGIYTWVVNRSKANTEAIKQVDDKHNKKSEETGKEITGISRRIEVIETNLNHLPSHEDLGKLYERLNAVSSTMENMRGEIGGMNRNLSMISEHLLSKGGEK